MSAASEQSERKGGEALRAGQVEEALAIFRVAVEKHPESASAHSGLGWALLQSGRDREALDELRQASALAPNRADAFHGMGLALGALGCVGRANEALGEAVRLAPHVARAHFDFAQSLVRLDRHEQALCEFEEASRLDPSLWEAPVNLGSALTELSRFEAAAVAYRRALDGAGRVHALEGLGVAMAALGRHTEAIDALRRAVELKPSDAWLRGRLSQALRDAGFYDEALAEALEGARLDPDSSALSRVGTILVHQRRWQEAERWFSRALQHNPGPGDFYASSGISVGRDRARRSGSRWPS